MTHPILRAGLLAILLALGVGLAVPARSDDATAPAIHLGVTSCAGSTCHGMASTTKAKSHVVQNEYLIWQRNDKHARAFAALQSPLGQRIAANLGIRGPADASQRCLTCHADDVPTNLQGVQFQISDGVGCEACHGGGQPWLGQHVTGLVSHSDLVQHFGLYPTDNPVKRASLCLGCHLGDDKHLIDHSFMGAGHPRMPFELQTFTQIEPAHYVIDDIYTSRKGPVAQGVQVWAVGQAMALEQLVRNVARHQGREGAFPELIYFDCASCHHSTDSLRWQRRSSMGLPPGVPHFNDANGIMLRAIAQRVAPDLARELYGALRSLHQTMSLGGGNPAEAANKVGDLAHSLQTQLAGTVFTAGDMRAMLAALGQSARDGDASDYAAAEQATMGFASIIYTLNVEHLVDAGQYAALKAGLDRCYAATQVPDQYDPQAFTAAAQAVAGALPPS